MNRLASRAFAWVGLAAVIAGCAASTADEGTENDSEAIRNCPRGICPDPPPKPKPTPKPPAPQPSSVSVTAAQLGSTLGLAFGGTEIQISQNDQHLHSLYEWGCDLESVASLDARKAACREACSDGSDDSISISNCFKSCAQMQPSCNYECGTRQEGSYIHFAPGLQGRGSQPYNAQDCQASNGPSTEPAAFDRRLDIPNPIYTSGAGNCRMTDLDFTMELNIGTAVDLGGIHMYIDGTSDAPALSCDGVVPDMDFSNIVLVMNLVPTVVNGGLSVNAGAEFHAAVTAHNSAAAGLVWIGDAQNKVLSKATDQFNQKIGALSGPLSQALDTYVRSLAPANAPVTRYDHVTFGTDGRVTFYYF